MTKRAIMKQSGILLAGHQASSIVNFFIPVVVVRILSQHDFGIYKQMFLVSGTCAGLFGFGVAQSLYYFIPGAGALKRYFITQTYLLLALGGFAAFAAVTALAYFVWPENSFAALAPYLGALAAFAGLSVVAAGFEHALASEGRFAESALFNFLWSASRAAALILAVTLTGSLRAMLMSLVFLSSLALACALLYYYRRGLLSLSAVRADLLGSQLSYVLPYGAAATLAVLWQNLNQYIVSYLFSPASFAVYAVGCFQIPVAWLIADSLSYALMARIAELRKEGRIAETHELWSYSCVKLALIFIPLYALLMVTAGDLIAVLFTEKFAASAAIFRIMSVSLLLAFVRPSVILRTFGATGYLFKLGVAVLYVNAALAFPLIGAFGLNGSAAAFAVTVVINMLANLEKVRQVLGSSWAGLLPWRDLLRISAYSAVAAALAVAIKLPWDPAPIASLALSCAAFAVFYVTMVLRSSLLRPAEKDYLKGLAARFLKRGQTGGS